MGDGGKRRGEVQGRATMVGGSGWRRDVEGRISREWEVGRLGLE